MKHRSRFTLLSLIGTLVVSATAFPLHAADKGGFAVEGHEDYAMQQGGAWPKSWPRELDSLRRPSRTGLTSWSFQRPGEPLAHFGIRFTARAEFEAAWPHLLKVKSQGAPLILRRGPSFWLGGSSHGVCVHTPAAGKKPLSAQELKDAPWKTTNYLELIVDGKIVDLNRIVLPSETPIIDERFDDAASAVKADSRKPPATADEGSAKEKIAWGQEQHGLMANLRALKPTVKPGEPGEPIGFEIRLKNVSKKEIRVSGWDGQLSPYPWKFSFGEWEWSASRSVRGMILKPGQTASVRCLAATKRDTLTAEQRRRFDAVPFRHRKNDEKELVRLPEGVYRVQAASWIPGRRLDFLKTNTIELRVEGGQ